MCSVHLPPLFTHTWIAIQLIIPPPTEVASCGDFCITGEKRSDTSNLAPLSIWWKTYEMRGSQILISGISASPCYGQEVYVVNPLYRKSLQRGQRSQRTPWEEREDHVEEQDGTLLNQHSAQRDHNQAYTQTCTITFQIKVVFTSI